MLITEHLAHIPNFFLAIIFGSLPLLLCHLFQPIRARLPCVTNCFANYYQEYV